MTRAALPRRIAAILAVKLIVLIALWAVLVAPYRADPGAHVAAALFSVSR